MAQDASGPSVYYTLTYPNLNPKTVVILAILAILLQCFVHCKALLLLLLNATVLTCLCRSHS